MFKSNARNAKQAYLEGDETQREILNRKTFL